METVEIDEISVSGKENVEEITSEKTVNENFEDKESKYEELKIKLDEHFRDPFTRVCRGQGIKDRIPEKLILLPFVWFFCTYQLVLFGNDRSQFAFFLERNAIAMKHLLLKDWIQDYETMPYPPSTGAYAIYTIDELLDHINYTVSNVYNIPTTSVGSLFIRRVNETSKPVTLCIKYYQTGIYNELDEVIDAIDLSMKTVCHEIGDESPQDYGFNPSIVELMRSTDGKLVRLLRVDIDFKLSSVHLNIETKKSAQCFWIYGHVTFDNTYINGQITVKLKTNIEEFKCGKNTEKAWSALDIAISALVLLCCTLHGIFCLNGWITSAILYWKIAKYYSDKEKKRLSKRAFWEIFKLNDFILFVSHIITLIGSVMKITIDYGVQSVIYLSDATGILLGVGCLFTWISVLHYLAYDHVFNLLFSVMKRSAWTVIKFLACVSILFVGFMLCGWVVLGPYHLKFASLSSTFQSLLALINGDEVYVTFTAVDSEKQLVSFFNGFFVVVFLALFTIVTLNIFIAIFNTAYEHQQNNDYKKEHRSDLMEFFDKIETKTFDTKACSTSVERTCPFFPFLGCARCCHDE